MISLTISSRGDRVRADLDRTRAAIEKLRAELIQLDEAPLPLAETVARVMASVRDHAARDENRLISFALLDGPINLTKSRSHLDTLALLWSFAPDFVEKGIAAHLRPACADGLPGGKRASRASEIKAKLAELEDEAEGAWLDLLTKGLVVERDAVESQEEITHVLRVWDRVAT
jgi:hypothetical protein